MAAVSRALSGRIGETNVEERVGGMAMHEAEAPISALEPEGLGRNHTTLCHLQKIPLADLELREAKQGAGCGMWMRYRSHPRHPVL